MSKPRPSPQLPGTPIEAFLWLMGMQLKVYFFLFVKLPLALAKRGYIAWSRHQELKALSTVAEIPMVIVPSLAKTVREPVAIPQAYTNPLEVTTETTQTGYTLEVFKMADGLYHGLCTLGAASLDLGEHHSVASIHEVQAFYRIRFEQMTRMRA